MMRNKKRRNKSEKSKGYGGRSLLLMAVLSSYLRYLKRLLAFLMNKNLTALITIF